MSGYDDLPPPEAPEGYVRIDCANPRCRAYYMVPQAVVDMAPPHSAPVCSAACAMTLMAIVTGTAQVEPGKIIPPV